MGAFIIRIGFPLKGSIRVTIRDLMIWKIVHVGICAVHLSSSFVPSLSDDPRSGIQTTETAHGARTECFLTSLDKAQKVR